MENTFKRNPWIGRIILVGSLGMLAAAITFFSIENVIMGFIQLVFSIAFFSIGRWNLNTPFAVIKQNIVVFKPSIWGEKKVFISELKEINRISPKEIFIRRNREKAFGINLGQIRPEDRDDLVRRLEELIASHPSNQKEAMGEEG